jgi:hypothetical protein
LAVRAQQAERMRRVVKTAKAFDLVISPSLLAAADEIVE